MVTYPNSEIYFIKNCPIAEDNQVEFFTSNVAQQDWFLGAEYVEPSTPEKSDVNRYPNVVYSVNSNSYVRKDGYIQVKHNMVDFTECNYLLFRNHMPEVTTSGSTSVTYPRHSKTHKWFYAFVIDSQYVNPNTTNIYFEIDVWQTYMFDITINECMVERETVPRMYDTVGENTLYEDLDVSMVMRDRIPQTDIVAVSMPFDIPIMSPSTRNYELVTVIYSSDDVLRKTSTDTPYLVLDDIPQSCWMYTFFPFHYANGGGLDLPRNEQIKYQTESVAEFLGVANENNKADSIISVVSVPLVLFSNLTPTEILNMNNSGRTNKNFSHVNEQFLQKLGKAFATIRVTIPPFFEGSTPTSKYEVVNMKCCTSQFCRIVVSDGASEVSYAPEYLNVNPLASSHVQFHIGGTLTPDGSVIIQPVHYGNTWRGMYTGQVGDAADVALVSKQQYPQSVTSTDLYSQWLAQQGAQNMIQGIAGAASMAVGVAGVLAALPTGGMSLTATAGAVAAGTAASTAIGGGASAAMAQANRASASKQADKANGAMISSASRAMRSGGITVYLEQPKREVVRMIDHFFTMYGYKIMRAKRPEFVGGSDRAKYSYIKTINCSYYGNIPLKYMVMIRSMFNNGVRMWKANTIDDIKYDLIGFNDHANPVDNPSN